MTLSALACLPLSAQITRDRLKEDLTRAGGLMHSYEFNEISDTKPPKGFKPFYISHYGRHGSRFHHSAEKFGTLQQVLRHAESIGNLTSDGLLLLAQTDSVLAAHDKLIGELTSKGQEEHKLIARRMSERFPSVFSDRKRNLIDAYSSVVRRCVLSMASSTSTLLKLNPHLDVHYTADDRIYPTISMGAVFSESKTYFAPILDNMLSSAIDWDSIAAKVFKDPSVAEGSAFSHGQDIWNMWSVCQCFEQVHIDILKYFTFDQLFENWRIHSGIMYLRFVDSPEFGKRLHKGMAPLLCDFVQKADEAIAGGKVAATLRYGHDSTIMPLAAYMGLEGFTHPASVDDMPSEFWDFSTKVCMATNLQMVFYRNRKGEVLVKFVYNENEVTVPALVPVYGEVYYSWESVRDYFAAKM